NLNEKLLLELYRAKQAGQAAFSHALRSMPTESFIFFMAMGAVVAGQLIMNFAQNPVAMQQNLKHQLSPVGILSFFVFMSTQGLTANMLTMYFSNKMVLPFIPYLGMTVGFFTQTYVSQMLSDPNVSNCAITMLGGEISEKDQQQGVSNDPCHEAYQYFVVQKKIFEYAPNLVSMLMSSVFAGLTQGAVSSFATKLTPKVVSTGIAAARTAVANLVIDFGAIDLALVISPGGMELKGIRLFLSKGLQIALFVSIDAWLNRKVNRVWKNHFDGNEFAEINENISTEVQKLNASPWQNSEALVKDIKTFHEKMTKWRTANLSEIYEAHQAWSENLNQLVSMYNSSRQFYEDFVDEVRTTKFDSGLKRLLRTYPLNGVRAKEIEPGGENLYFTKPQTLVHQQADTVYEVADLIEKQIFPDAIYKSLYSQEQAQLKNIHDLLNSGDRKTLTPDDYRKMAQGLDLLNKTIEISAQQGTSSRDFVSLLQQIRTLLGDPDPMMEPGRGYLATYEKAPATAEKIKETSYYRQVGEFRTPHITDYLLMQMACGPDAEHGETPVKTSQGFSSVFLPPRIGNEKDQFEVCTKVGVAKQSVQNIYTWPLEVSSRDGNRRLKYAGFLDYIINNLRPSVLGSKEEKAFPQWWKNTTDKQMNTAFEDFAGKYDEIVSEMVRILYGHDRKTSGSSLISSACNKIKNTLDKQLDRSNSGPISNGPINSIFQQERAYLSILDQVFAPTSDYKLDIANILSKNPTHPLLQDVEKQFAILNGLLLKIKVVQKNGHDVVESDIENYQFEDQVKNVQKSLTKVAEELGVSQAGSGGAASFEELSTAGAAWNSFEKLSAGNVKWKDVTSPQYNKDARVTPAQRDVAVLVLEKLEAL
ncbi:MAG TPA: hypothetical protein VN132_01410, partial [Bdellovibrio sp.]|nr:hypothetical protein [Bdellovibrio sp.]